MQILANGFVETPSLRSLVGGAQMGGAMLDVAPDATPFPHRDGYLTSILPSWTDPALDDEIIEWTDRVYKELLPYTVSGVYANHLGTDADERVAEAYGKNFQRLTELKAKYDPDNFFHRNVNIKPAH
jgi:FAD/FMN-containing dehydrogenase